MGCRSRSDGEGKIGRDGGCDGVPGDRGEVGEQGLEAVDGKAVVGPAGGLLADGGGRALGLGDDAGAERVCGFLVGVVVEDRRQALAHVPFQIVSEHAEEDVGAHPVGKPVVDRPDVQIDGFHRTDRVLDEGEGLVAHDRGAVVEGRGGQGGAHGVEAVEGRFGGDLRRLAFEGPGRSE